MEIIRDILDKQLIDRRGRKMGRVDGLVFEYSDSGAPRVARIEVGAVVLANRLGERYAGWVRAISRRWGPERLEPYAIPWAAVRRIDRNDIDVAFDFEQSELVEWERWLRERIISRIPGS